MLEKVCAVALLVASLGLATAAAAEAGPASETSPLLHGKLEISLAEAIRMGLENNLGVQVQRFEPLIAGLDEDGAWGAYDPELFGEVGFEDAYPKTASFIQGLGVQNTNTDTFDGVGGIRGEVPMLGATYGLELSGSRIESDATFRSLNPEYNSALTFSARIPLLKNLIWNQPWTQVRTTRIQHFSAQEDFRSDVMDLVRNVEDAYWQLIADEAEVRVAIQSLETAGALLAQTKTQFEVGVVSRVEVTEADAGVQAREFNLIVAENNYRNQQDVLIDLVLGPGLRATSTLELAPTDRPNPKDFVDYEIDVEQAVSLAFDNRPELEVARQQIERQEVEKQFAWNQRLPELDVVGSYEVQGLSGRSRGIPGDPTATPPVPAVPARNINGNGYLENYPDGNTWSVRGVMSIPIPNTSARKTYDRRLLELRRAEVELQRVEQTIVLEVRRASRNLKASQEGIESAERATEAAQEQLRAEKIRNEYGEATPFDVLQREEDLVDREVERIEAYRAYYTSATELDRAQGTILRTRNIKIDDVSALR
jgi:outer membrane protein TolC